MMWSLLAVCSSKKAPQRVSGRMEQLILPRLILDETVLDRRERRHRMVPWRADCSRAMIHANLSAA